MLLKDRVAIITGAGHWKEEGYVSGIGHAISTEFAREGARVVVNDVSETAARNTAEEINALPGIAHKAIAIKADVSNMAEVEAMVEGVLADYGRVDILVNAAAMTLHRWGLRLFHEVKEEEASKELSVTLVGAINCTRAVIPQMLQQNGGNIIFISSGAGVRGAARQSMYATSKAGLLGFCFTLAQEYGPNGIRANCILPGATRTRVTQRMPQAYMDALLQRIPLRRMAEPREIARVAVCLASDEFSYVTGVALGVDGGIR